MELVRAASDSDVTVMESSDSDDRRDRGSVSSSPSRAQMKTSAVALSMTIMDKKDNDSYHLVGCAKQTFAEKADDDDEVERGRGRRTTTRNSQWTGLNAARTRSTQPSPSRPQETRPPQTHRVPTEAAGAAVDHQRLRNRDKGSFDEGLVVSSIPCGYSERNSTRAAPGDVNGGRTLAQEVPPTSVEVAPFHGLVPASPFASSSSNVNNDALGGRAPSMIFNPTADGHTACQNDGSFLDTVAVVGISVRQQASNKGFHQRLRPTGEGNNQYQHQHQKRRSQENALGAKDTTVTVPITTWDKVGGRRDHCREGTRRDSDQGASDDVKDSAVIPPGTGEPTAATVRDGGRDSRGRPGSFHFNASSEQPDGSSSQEPSGTTVSRKSHAHKALPFEVDAASSAPSSSPANAAGADTTMLQLTTASSDQSNKIGGGVFSMGISGTSVKSLPWRERREGSTALIAAARSGADSGATRRRTRSEKTSKAPEPSNRGGSCNHAGDSGGDYCAEAARASADDNPTFGAATPLVGDGSGRGERVRRVGRGLEAY